MLAFAAAGGGAYAATQSSGANPHQAFLNDVAKRLGVSPQRLTAAMKAAMIDRLNAAVKAGKLTQAEANAIEKRIQQNEAPPFLSPGLGSGRFGPPPFFGVPPGLGPLASAAQYLGLTDVQLLHELASGKSLAALARAHGKSVSGLENAMTKGLKAKLDMAVSAGRLTRSQEEKILSVVSSRLGAFVNGQRQPFGPWRGGSARPWSRGFGLLGPLPAPFAAPGA